MQDEDRSLKRSPGSSKEAARWCRFDRVVQEIKALHTDIPAQQLQTVIDEACAAVRQERALWAAGEKETS